MFLSLFHDDLVGVLSSYFCCEAVFVFDPDDLFVVHDNLLLSLQLHFDRSPAVFRFSLFKDLLDNEVVVAVSIWQIGVSEPTVISAPGYAGDVAQELRAVLEQPNDLKLLIWS